MIDIVIFAAPVALAALGETVGQRAGVINIGLEGVMLLAAFVGAMVALNSGSSAVGLVAGTAAGLALTMAFAWFAVRLAVDQIVAGTALNLLALGLTNTLFRGQFGQSGRLLSIPTVPRVAGIDAVILLMLLLVPLISWLLHRTNWGLTIRAVGENPVAAEASGFSVTKLRFGAMAIAGVLAGLAGAYLAVGVTGAFAENMTAGRGFVAIAMVTFGRWKPIWVFAASLLIGYAESLQFTLQARGSGVPYQLLLAMPYVLALVVLVFVGRSSPAPAALTIPYRREQ